ncbi:hypothetical protein ASD65_14615 [Microbacterium sp. Root61]|uniref:FtsX-like permease family protein n=1 Tax=Microbacterium sp. Root61 TaxID=1736570 RepID=UPI0006FBF6B9|nr:FtsX-like permease family protein [Microbacterium sp. Root61]KRA25513.1 hypothetical protein ASD65_14615 [Microbacterium sp. Root61]
MSPNARARFVSAARLGAKRTTARLGLVGSIAFTIAVSVALLCGLLAWISLDSRDALDGAIPAADEVGGWAQVQTRIADDTDAQDAAASALFDQLFGDTADIERMLVGEPGSDAERVAWRITPHRATLDGAAVLRLDQGVTALSTAFRESDAAVQGSESSGSLGVSLDSAAQGVRASAAIAPVPVAIAGILAWFAVLELGRLLGAARGREAGLLRARGLSRGQSASLSFTESAAIVAAATVVGFGVALGLLALRPGGAATVLTTWPLALGLLVVLTATLAIAQARAARIASSARASAGRAAQAASIGVAALVVLGAAVLVWQSVSLRSLPSDDPWRVGVTALAPTFGVAAVGILAVLLFAPLATTVAAVAGRSPGLSPAYPARQVARRVVAFSVAVALVAIALCGATLAASYIATWRSASTDSAQLAAGTDLRADFAARPVLPADVATAGAVDGVTADSPAIAVPIVAGELAAALVALPADAIPKVMLAVPGAAQPMDLAATLAGDPVGLELPEGSTGLALGGLSTPQAWSDNDGNGVDIPNPDAGSDLIARMWVTDATGATVSVDTTIAATPEGEGRRFVAAGDLPDGAAPWRLIAVDLSRGRGWQNGLQQLRIEELRVASLADGVVEPVDIELPQTVTLTGWGLEQPSTSLLWSSTGATATVVPAVVTTAFAQVLGLTVGDDAGIRFDGTGRSYTVEVAAVVDAIPGVGSGPGMLTSLDVLSAASLVTGPRVDPPLEPPLANQVWAAGPPSAAADLVEVLDVSVETPMDAASAVTAGLVAAWWACAIGGALLAGVALVALLTALTGQRAGEVLVLRAVGVAPRRQARMRTVEASVVVILAAALGTVGGFVLSWLVIPGLAEAAVPGTDVEATFAVDPWPILAAVVVIGVALVAFSIGGSTAVRRQGASTRLEEAAP